MIYDSSFWLEDIGKVLQDLPELSELAGKSVLISGATGMIGSCLIDVLMEKNREGLDCKVYALGRDAAKARSRFGSRYDSANFEFIPYDINKPLERDLGRIDHILHLASNTHPIAYSSDPIGTITTNIIGTNNLLKYAVQHGTERFLFASSGEVYGENRGDVEMFDESYLGNIDCNTLRAGYPESKRCGEALCQAYKKQSGLDIVIPRLSRTYGPTMLMNDSKAMSQFIRKGVAGENIVLKSAGTQYFSYLYVSDAVAGILTVLLRGAAGEAYNIADSRSDTRLKDIACFIAENVGTEVCFEAPDSEERAGYSTATKARLNSEKLQALGWRARYDIHQGVKRTIDILRCVQSEESGGQRREGKVE